MARKYFLGFLKSSPFLKLEMCSPTSSAYLLLCPSVMSVMISNLSKVEEEDSMDTHQVQELEIVVLHTHPFRVSTGGS